MSQDQLIIIKEQLSQIVDMLILNGTLTECPGLVHGKMGIVIFFFHYARFTGNELFADYAYSLLAEIQSQLHVNSPADYENGIAGIGVGVDYLIRRNFLVTEEDIFDDLDQRMTRAVLYDPWRDFSLYSGLVGYGRYWIMRLRYESSSVCKCLSFIIERIKEKLPYISNEERIDVYCFLHDLRMSGFNGCLNLSKIIQEESLLPVGLNHFCSRLDNSVIGRTVQTFQNKWYFNDIFQEEIDDPLNQLLDLDVKKTPISMGLLTGYSGEGLLRLTTINKMDMSWMTLL